MSKAIVTFEDEGDQVKIGINFGEGGGNETSGAHQMAVSAVHGLQTQSVTNYERTAGWLKACGKEPGPENLSTQIGCDLEETAELLRCLRVSGDGWARLVERLVSDLESLGIELKRGRQIAHFPNHLRENVLDALCDREVTGNGVAYMAGFNKPLADQAVMDSNDAKLVDGKPVILDGGKIGKPEGWKPPDLRAFV